MKWIRSILLLLVIGSCHAQEGGKPLPANKDNNTLLWEISGHGLSSPSYLFGSFHLLCRSDIHFSNNLLLAVKTSKEIYMEIDLDDPSTILSSMLLMNMNNDKKLKDLYTAAEYSKLDQFFTDSLHLPLSLFPGMKPAFLESMLYPKMMPCKTISGVEEELVLLAKKEKKAIQGLETMAFQASVFDSIPYEEQAKELLQSIDSISAEKRSMDSMVMVYKNQRLDEIEKLFSKTEFGMDSHQDLLLNNRNRNWVGQLKIIMKKEPVFVAVGAGHLVGELGLISLLRKEGYTLRPIENRN